MNTRFSNTHNIDSFAALLLFALYVIFLLFLLLFGAGNYRASVQDQNTENNLYTASSYITTKFRQHDQPDCISLQEIQGIQTLCFRETISEKEYSTYIYFQDGSLKELFTASDSLADLSMGTALARLVSFSVEEKESRFFSFTLTDEEGHSSSFILHQ